GSRLVSMDVDLDCGFVTHDQRRFAPARNLLSDVVDRKMLAIDDELGAVSPPRLGRGDHFRAGMLNRRFLEGGQGLSLQPLEEPSRNAAASWAASTDARVPTPTAKPRKIWERMTPEFPRAPISAPWAARRATLERSASSRSRMSPIADCRVSSMLVPVSP